jgi:hypothetical protein
MIYLVINALDECVVDLSKLLKLVTKTSELLAYIKWLVLSRNDIYIEQKLGRIDSNERLSLELEKNVD